MPPKKQQQGKKAAAKKQNQLIEDKTFGLKNKNKSKNVQKYITTVEKSVKCTEAQRTADAAKNKKVAAKEAKKAQEAELAALFNEALTAGAKKGTPVNEETLAKWKADRKAKKLLEERRKVEAEMRKKSKGKGLSVLSGRALFDYDATLFEDDADAVDNETMKQRNDEEGGDEREDNGESKSGAAVGAAGAALNVEEALFEGEDEDLDDLDIDEGT